MRDVIRTDTGGCGPTWNDHRARQIGWLILGKAREILLAHRSQQSKRLLLGKELRRLSAGLLGDHLLQAAACCDDPVRLLADWWDNKCFGYVTERREFALRTTVQAFVNKFDPPQERRALLEETCLTFFGRSGPTVRWPDELEVKLKAERHLPCVTGHISDHPTKGELLRFFEENPYHTWNVRQFLENSVARGSRRQTFLGPAGGPIEEGLGIVSIYPERHAVWISSNLVALRPEGELLRRQNPCVERALRLHAFLQFKFDPERYFAPNSPHNVLGFLCDAKDLVDPKEEACYTTELRRALVPFDPQTFGEMESARAIRFRQLAPPWPPRANLLRRHPPE
jgi:hypothetical protein